MILSSTALCACTTPKHTDLMVFGTNTQFGVSVDAGASTSPQINIGYKRQEAVLMPLLANGKDSRLTGRTGETQPGANTQPSTPEQIAGLKYLGVDTKESKQDTYSVLASFGASGSGDTSGKANVALAQFFATGIAARSLAVAGGALVNTSDKAAEASETTAASAAATQTQSLKTALDTSSTEEAQARAEILQKLAGLTDDKLEAPYNKAVELKLIPTPEAGSDTPKPPQMRSDLNKYSASGQNAERLKQLKAFRDFLTQS